MDTTTTKKCKGLFALAALAVLIIGGVLTAYAAGNVTDERMTGKQRGMGMSPGNHTLSENASKTEVKEEFMQNAIEELGLDENATIEEIMTAMSAKRNETKAAIQEALDEEDYDAWKALVEDTRYGAALLEKVTEDNFDEYIQMQEYLSKAEDLADQIGIPATQGRMVPERHMGGPKRTEDSTEGENN